MLEPILLNAATHLNALGVPPWKDSTSELLARRNRVFRLVREALEHGSYQLDEILNTMVMLAAGIHTIGFPPLPKEPNPCSTPMLGMQWLDVYITRPLAEVHWSGVQRLLELHGGIHALTKYSLPFHLTLAGLMHSAMTATKPVYPFMQPDGQEFPDLSPLEYLRLGNAPTGLLELQGFSVLSSLGIPWDFASRFTHLRQLSWIIAEGLDLVDRQNLLDCRNMVQHRIMSLPESPVLLDPSDALFHTKVLAQALYNACRTAALLYSIHVTFPLPRPGAAKERLVPQLRNAIKTSIQHSECTDECRRVLFWCSIFGGIVSSVEKHRPWFVARCHDLGLRLGVQSWEQAREILLSFVWLDSACNEPGRNLWYEVMDLEKNFVA
ncbi:hypothetical protein BGZ63DRAFT_357631 [Mariannaea sp. PMI_226]|nr:hypothetical protein BGZ63DRAFT_357631 [Mariannaea sp. PMI_226]